VNRTVAAMLAAIFILGAFDPAVCGSLRAAERVSSIPLETPSPQSHTWAYASLVLGGGLIAGSFAFANRANHSYDRYLESTDPEEIERLFERTEHYDRLSSGTLLAGELLVVAGLYLRFLRRPVGSRVSLSLGPEQCRVAWRF
jgi:hypothetical protein